MWLNGLHFVDVAEIQEEIKKVPKEEFLPASQKLYGHVTVCIYDNGTYFL
jgi:hypothetical protein